VSAGVGISLERLRLPARTVQGEHQLLSQALAERIPPDELPQLADELAVTAGGEIGVDASLERLEARLLEPSLRIEQRPLGLEVGQRLAAPEVERRPEDPRGVVALSLVEQPATLAVKPLEPHQVERLRRRRQDVAAGPRLQHVVRLEQLPQPGDVLLERSRGVLRRRLAPQLLDQPVARDDRARVEQQQREQASLLRAAETYLPLVLPDLERAEETEIEARSQSATVPRRSVSELTAPVSDPEGTSLTLGTCG
jgi:hypothetical protein